MQYICGLSIYINQKDESNCEADFFLLDCYLIWVNRNQEKKTEKLFALRLLTFDRVEWKYRMGSDLQCT